MTNLSKEIGLYTVTLVNELNIRVSFIFKDSIIYCKHYKSKKSALKHFEWVATDIWWNHKNDMAWEYTGVIPRAFFIGSLNNEKHSTYFIGYESKSVVEKIVLELFGEKIMAWTVTGLRGSIKTAGIYKLMCDRINEIKLLKV